MCSGDLFDVRKLCVGKSRSSGGLTGVYFEKLRNIQESSEEHVDNVELKGSQSQYINLDKT